jgi:hypothetical protein
MCRLQKYYSSLWNYSFNIKKLFWKDSQISSFATKQKNEEKEYGRGEKKNLLRMDHNPTISCYVF